MSEVAEKTPIASLGKNQTFEFTAPPEQKQGNEGGAGTEENTERQDNLTVEATIELTAEKKAENIAAGLNEDGSPKTEAPKLTKEQIKELYEKEFPTTAELTPEQKKAAEDALDKKRLDWFVAHGGTVDAYAAMKLVKSGDLTELSEKEFEKEMKDNGFTEEEKVRMRQTRYFQLEEESIEDTEDEAEKAFLKKAKEYGTKKLNTKAQYKQNLAVGFFENIDKALASEQSELVEEKELADKVDSHFQTVPDKITLQLGKTTDNVDITPLDLPIPPEALTEVRELLRDTTQRNKFLYTEDGSPNIAALSEILIRNKVLEAAANKSYLKAVSETNAKWEETFPVRDANALGIGALLNGSGLTKTKGKIASVGKAQMT